MPLEGKVAVVTGAARGLGRAFCARLAAEGANLAAVDIDFAGVSLADLPGAGEKIALRCDVSDAAQIKAVEREVSSHFGRCDILVNNAGIYPLTPFDSLTLEEWHRVQATNVDSVLLFAMAFAPAMKATGWGRIVNLGSGITTMQAPEMLPYITSKGAVHALTRALANELGASGITVNAIAPSIVPTEGIYSRLVAPAGMTNDQELDLVISLQTIKRPSVPEDLANALAFLVSEDAGFMTGQIVHVDGGLVRSGA
jgi:NAD(P)-dependent dehydrogenase (short-subunit alcohol dehydrogenase family)